MLGLAPDSRGLLPDSDVARLKDFGDALKRMYGHNLVSNPTAQLFDGDPETIWVAPEAHTASINYDFKTPVTFDRVVTMEWLNGGQRVQKYDIQVKNETGWHKLVEGTSVGHKKIDIFPRVTGSQIRMRILSATDHPVIRDFQVYDGGR